MLNALTAAGLTFGSVGVLKASGKSGIIDVVFDTSDTIQNMISDGFLLDTMAQNPDVLGYEGVKAAVSALEDTGLGGVATDTGISVLKN